MRRACVILVLLLAGCAAQVPPDPYLSLGGLRPGDPAPPGSGRDVWVRAGQVVAIDSRSWQLTRGGERLVCPGDPVEEVLRVFGPQALAFGRQDAMTYTTPSGILYLEHEGGRVTRMALGQVIHPSTPRADQAPTFPSVSAVPTHPPFRP